jgi:hypothetical protein
MKNLQNYSHNYIQYIKNYLKKIIFENRNRTYQITAKSLISQYE